MSLLRAVLLVTIAMSNSAFASWAQISDKDLFCGAELIVAGTLDDIQERFMSVTAKYGDDPSEWYIDLGLIKDARLIKGDELHEKDLRVLFDSKGQTGPFAHMKVTHSKGESGIWLISERDCYTGEYRLYKPTNPLPLSDEARILATLKKHKCK